MLGDGCFKVTWDSDIGRPVVSSVDPSGLWAWSQPGNVRQVRRVVQRYALQPEEAEDLFDLALPGKGRIQVVEDWTVDRLRIELNGQVISDRDNPYGRIPYVLFPNLGKPHELWGESDLVDLMDVCREINRRMTVISRILQVSGNPIVVLENVSGSDGIRADEGAIWELPEDSRAYLLDMLQGGGVQLHLEYVQLLFRTLFDLSETPRTSFGDSGRALSGTALEVEVQPLVQKVQRKRRIWDSVYRQRNALVLDQLERFGGEDLGGVRRSEPFWGPILPRDRDRGRR
ncbi:MAG: phage portal protein, partial [Actinomycetota bacterium]